MKTGWWRRNRWALLLLVPALVVSLYSPAKTMYTSYWDGQPHRPVTGAPGGWITFAGARMRLARLAVSAPRDFLGQPIAVPVGTQAWQADIDFDARDPTKIKNCQIFLEADDGDLFDPDPDELAGIDPSLDYCEPGDSDGTSSRYQTTANFLLPRNRRPVALRIIVTSKLPAYARLAPS